MLSRDEKLQRMRAKSSPTHTKSYSPTESNCLTMRTALRFDKVKQEKIKFLAQNKYIVLATSLENRVTARTVRYVSEGLNIIIFTLAHSKKVVQIKANQKVALCLNNVSIEGTAELIGRRKKEGKRLEGIIKKQFPGYLEWWLNRCPELAIFVKVVPNRIVSWIASDEKPLVEYLDLQKKKAFLAIPWEKQEY